MKLITPILLLTIIACSEDKINQTESLHTESEVDTTIFNTIDSIEKTQGTFTLDTFNIVDYYHFFFDTPITKFEKLNYKEAFEKKTFVLNELDYHNGYINFRTQNTPPDWDGDSQPETDFELTYWIIDNCSRIIALNESQITWVSESSKITFYKHDSTGINEFFPLERMWHLNDFTEKDVEQHFEDSLANHPPVFIRLPKEGKDIQISLAIHEYFEPIEIYETFVSLNTNYHPILVNPIESWIK